MTITVEIQEERIAELVRNRIAELFSDDGRFRESSVRSLVNKIVDQAAVGAVKQASENIADKLPALAAEAVSRQVKIEIDNAARRGLSALRKLYAGFNPAALTPEQRAWLENQIASSAKHGAQELTK